LFGADLDAVMMALNSKWLAFAEDAGEMLAMSALVWYVHRRLIGEIGSRPHPGPKRGGV
jgi:hypothetical protein